MTTSSKTKENRVICKICGTDLTIFRYHECTMNAGKELKKIFKTNKEKREIGEKKPICSYCKKPMVKDFVGLYTCWCRTDFSKIEVSGGSGEGNNAVPQPTSKENLRAFLVAK